ncbi:MAG: PfkB family carbohydrate kinase [Candidatus Cloacimonetes bacterium]|nr:PfkB family carbohydrate kinase [Candidatus Cloacimonadota bacterium]MDD3378786.1 PfkB family carbohydrate kinase [Candidatus Methanomethylophilaceae archaeon]
MSKEPFLSVYGHITIDQIISIKNFPSLNESVDVVSKKTTLGGTGTNIAVVAAKLGVPTAICSFVGSDFPVQYEDIMKDSGLIMDELVKVDDYETSLALVLNNSAMEQEVIFYQGPQGCASKLGRMLVDSAKRSQYVHFCTGEPEYYISVMNVIRPSGLKIALDPAQEIYKMWDKDKLTRAIELSDALFCNDYEAKAIEKHLEIGDVLSVNEPLVVRTLGDNGSIARINGELYEIPVVKGNAMVDATGAGDAYRAGFYAGLYNKYSIKDSLVIAAAVSSFVVEKVGALTNVPTWDMVLERVEKYLK